MNIERAEMIAYAIPVGQRNLDQMQKDIRVTVSTLMRICGDGLLPTDPQIRNFVRTRKITRCIPAGKNIEWRIVLSRRTKKLTVSVRTPDENLIYVGSFFDCEHWKDKVGVKLNYISLIYDLLPYFVKGLLKEFPEAENKLKPFLSAAQKQL